MCKLSKKRNSIPLWKKCDIVVSINSDNGTEVAILAKDFDIPTTTLTAVSTNKDKIVSLFLIRVYVKT